MIQLEKIRRNRRDWQDWLYRVFPSYVTAPFAQRHIELWDWIDDIQTGIRPRPFCAFWPRGGAKSTSAELGTARIGAKQRRKYIWYISGTQEQADKHVETIGALLESDALAKHHPTLGERKIGKYGYSKGWRRERLRTMSGLTIDALGLDVGSRGAKIEEARPDMMILDDVDDKGDTMQAVAKKIDTLTTSILPAGSNDCAVLFIQNLIHPQSIASQLADGRADFLADRILSGPFPAVEGLTYEQRDGKFVITGGTATWEGQSLEVCQSQITTWGLTAFLKEAQHNVEISGGIWDHVEFQHVAYDDLPDFVRGAVWVDPAVTSTDNSDCMGIQGAGITEDSTVIMVYSWEAITSPEDAIKRAILKALEWKFDRVGVETDQGGDTWQSVYTNVCATLRAERPELADVVFPSFASNKAGAGHGPKVERNARMLADYERGKVKHMTGTHTTLESALRRFPLKPLDLADAAYWVWDDLASGIRAAHRIAFA